ncbi:tetratricopeptide repeat protein [Alphaproteobacteria bacterium]|nr:tetratricopeptide repeat protein [Alphaproteobacteria bacterium]
MKLTNSQSENKTTNKSPPHSQINDLLDYYQKHEFVEAEKQAIFLTQEFPYHQLGWKVLGILLGQKGKNNEALIANKRSVELSPNDAEAHTNLGNSLSALGRMNEAEISYKNAIKIKPDFAEAHSNLGVTLERLRRTEEAFRSYVKALNLKPDFIIAKINLSRILKRIRFKSSNPELYPLLTNLLTSGNFTRPKDISACILSLLKNDPLIQDIFSKKTIHMDIEEVEFTIKSLEKFPILHYLMRLCPLPDLQFEDFFKKIRSSLLINAELIPYSSELIYFLSTLSLHCFTNEYIYEESEKENILVEKLENRINSTFAKSQHENIIDILILANYRPLHNFDWSLNIKTLDQLKEVKLRLIIEPHQERELSLNINMLKKVSNNVSSIVKEQYEDNPYPRWIKLGKPIKQKSILEFFNESNLNLYSENIKNLSSPSILIAGGGTGQHPIETACRFKNSEVLAIDLSFSSLAYAIRKTKELRLDNIEYLQADILDLHLLNKRFDIIESLGVLHHMNDPIEGWKILVNLLETNGLMKIGLYSELARQDILNIKKDFSSKDIKSVPDIKKVRKAIIDSNLVHKERLCSSEDFYNLSTLRDLIFHVQEHQFTIPKIKENLKKLGLKFCGFENKEIVSQFKDFYDQKSDIYNLDLWHKFEENNPNVFAGMYQFWSQKF